MNKSLKSIILFFIIVSCLLPTTYANVVKKESQKPQRSLLIFTASWCPPCQKMKKESWSNPTIKKVIKKHDYTMYWLDVDKVYNRAYMKAWKVKTIPKIIMVRTYKKKYFQEIKRSGYKNTKDLQKWLNYISTQKNEK